jgi:hypothetical protein
MEEFRRINYPGRFLAFHRKKNLHSSEEHNLAEMYGDESSRENTFNITIKYASQVDLQSLLKYKVSGTSLVTPQEAIQAAEIVLHNAPAFGFVRVGRPFCTPPKD